jgi:tRNA (cytidine/uridine-2'-O-)-methyltransferase
MSRINIVLVEPEIPQNTGNIARTCAILGAKLHLVKPLGFDISEKAVRRAGLDYWDKLNIIVYENLEDFKQKVKSPNIYLLSTKAKKVYSEVDYTHNDEIYLVFGPESRGLNESYIKENFDNSLRIPMRDGLRSLNLSNSVAIMIYEALRQQDYNDLSRVEPDTFKGKDWLLK